MTIFFYKGLTKNPEIRNTPSEFCQISGDQGELGIPNQSLTITIILAYMLYLGKRQKAYSGPYTFNLAIC